MEMISIPFPPIHKSVKVDKKKPEYAGNYVNIRNGVAVIVSTNGIFCFDLKNFFIESQLVPNDMEEQFEELFNFLEGKSFNHEFWEFLTKGDSLKVLDNDCLYIENDKINKSLIYEYRDVDLKPALDLLKKNYTNNGPKGTVLSGLKTPALKQFLDGFGKTIQSNSILIEYTTEAGLFRFTVNNIPYIFGLFSNDYSITEKQFMFDYANDFIKSLDVVPAPPSATQSVDSNLPPEPTPI